MTSTAASAHDMWLTVHGDGSGSRVGQLRPFRQPVCPRGGKDVGSGRDHVGRGLILAQGGRFWGDRQEPGCRDGLRPRSTPGAAGGALRHGILGQDAGPLSQLKQAQFPRRQRQLVVDEIRQDPGECRRPLGQGCRALTRNRSARESDNSCGRRCIARAGVVPRPTAPWGRNRTRRRGHSRGRQGYSPLHDELQGIADIPIVKDGPHLLVADYKSSPSRVPALAASDMNSATFVFSTGLPK
jgi:hypothetical protein